MKNGNLRLTWKEPCSAGVAAQIVRLNRSAKTYIVAYWEHLWDQSIVILFHQWNLYCLSFLESDKWPFQYRNWSILVPSLFANLRYFNGCIMPASLTLNLFGLFFFSSLWRYNHYFGFNFLLYKLSDKKKFEIAVLSLPPVAVEDQSFLHILIQVRIECQSIV